MKPTAEKAPGVAESALSPFGLLIDLAPGDQLGAFDRDRVLDQVLQHRLVLIRGLAPQSREQLLGFCAQNIETELLHWDSGPVMELKVQADPANYLFSTERVPFHFDGAFHVVPSFLVFSCIEAPDPTYGGETLFCDGDAIWRDASPEQKQLWQRISVAYQTEKKAHYGGTVRSPLTDKHPHTGRTVLRYAEPVETEMNPVLVRFVDMAEGEQDRLMGQLGALLYDERYCYAHQWQEGDLLIADNHALVHGRNGFTASTSRHLRRVQIL